MDRKYITLIILMFLILFSFVLTVSESTNSDLNTKVNKSGDTMTNTLHVPVVSNEDGNYFTTIDLSPLNYLRLTISDDHGLNAITMEGDKTTFSQKIDMNGNNITNCPNCGGGADNLSWQNSKVNKTGDNMTGILQVNNTITSLRLRIFDTNRTVPISEKPQSTDDLIIEKQNTNQMRMLSWGNTTGAGNYFGAGVYSGTYTNPLPTTTTPWLFAAFGDAYDGVGATSAMTYAAAFGMKTTGTWNGTFHGGQMIFYTRKPTNTLNSLTMGDDGNITLSASAGSGYRFACWTSSGKLIQSDVSCDLI